MGEKLLAMARGDKVKRRESGRTSIVYPPGLVPVLRERARDHGLRLPLADGDLEQLLVSAFFASLRAEEHERHPLRIAITQVVDESGRRVDPPGWELVRFQRPVSCTARQLVRLARAARSERLYAAVATQQGRLTIAGLAREKSDPNAPTLKLIAPEPGSLEVWIGHRRVLDYAQGRLMDAPENLLVMAGSVRTRLEELAMRTGIAEYVECVTSLVRHVAGHPHGGILILTDVGLTESPGDGGFLLEAGMSAGAVLGKLESAIALEEPARTLQRDGLRAELERTLAEIGRLSALDGATLLDTRLNVLGFGVILPVIDDVRVLEALDAAATSFLDFPLRQYGARHRAAASFAATHPDSVVFLASADGDMACMLRHPDNPHVTMWRFRLEDLSFER